MEENEQTSSSPSTNSDPEEKGSEKSQRKKRWATKVRTGCITCKTRRIKCDEGKPVCQRCKTSGYRCHGYKALKPWLFDNKPEDNNLPFLPIQQYPFAVDKDGYYSRGLLYPQQPQVSSLTPRYGSLPEMRSLQYFIEHTGSLFKNDPLSTHYWTRVVPSLSWVDDAVKHSISAVSLMTEFAAQPANSLPQTRQMALVHYGKALQLLSKSYPSPITILITSEIFWSMETLCMNFQNARVHLTAMIRILNEWRSGRISAGTYEEDALIRTCIAPSIEKMHITRGMKPERRSPTSTKVEPTATPNVDQQSMEETSDPRPDIRSVPLATSTDTMNTYERDSKGLYRGETWQGDVQNQPPSQPEVQSLLQSLVERRTALVAQAIQDS